MLGVTVNTISVILGSLLGLLIKKGIPERISDALMKGVGLCTVCIAVSGVIKGSNSLIMIISVIAGGFIGTLINIDAGLTKISAFLEKKANKNKTEEKKVNIAQGFISGSLLFCIGAMTVVGSLNAGLTGDNEMLYTKSVLDLISSCILSATLGPGVMLSAVFVFVFQGGIALLAGLAAPYLSDTAVTEMTCAGSVLILGLGLNILGITKIKIANYLPAVFIPIILCLFM